jgi:hypothetical protein
MSTIRLRIIDALATLLATATGLTVYRNLDYALEDDAFPALVIERGGDTPDEDVSPLGVIDHQLLLKVMVVVAGSANPEAAADAYEAAIHAALMAATTAAGISIDVRWRGAMEPSFDLGDCGVFPLAYSVAFRTSYTSLES